MRQMLGLIFLLFIATAMGTWCPYDLAGPYQISQRHASYTFTNQSSASWKNGLKVKVYVTFPSDKDAEYRPYPVAVLINGFQCRASWYRSYAQHLASWGYAVLQYNSPAFQLIADTVEMACIEEILDTWLRQQIHDPSSDLHEKADLSKTAIVGHSRGAKLAALLYAGSNRFKAAFLIDPVDNTKDAPESPTCPNACKALRASGKQVGIVGAGIWGRCNPEGSNFKDFYRTVGEGSWLAVVKEAGHQQFLDAGWLLNSAFDLLCGRGRDSRPEVIALTKTPLVAWLDHAVRPQSCAQTSSPMQEALAPLEAFYRWVEREQADGKITFQIKGDAATTPPDPTGFATFA